MGDGAIVRDAVRGKRETNSGPSQSPGPFACPHSRKPLGKGVQEEKRREGTGTHVHVRADRQVTSMAMMTKRCGRCLQGVSIRVVIVSLGIRGIREVH